MERENNLSNIWILEICFPIKNKKTLFMGNTYWLIKYYIINKILFVVFFNRDDNNSIIINKEINYYINREKNVFCF